MARAITLSEFLIDHAQTAFCGAKEENEAAKYILGHLLDSGESHLTTREVLRLCRRFSRRDELDPGLRVLEENGYIVRSIEKKPAGGRPSETIYLNPEAGNSPSGGFVPLR
jgi:hypothetical protein